MKMFRPELLFPQAGWAAPAASKCYTPPVEFNKKDIFGCERMYLVLSVNSFGPGRKYLVLGEYMAGPGQINLGEYVCPPGPWASQRTLTWSEH